jgi:hypothetical protein
MNIYTKAVEMIARPIRISVIRLQAIADFMNVILWLPFSSLEIV